MKSSMLNNENIIFLLLLNCKACKLKNLVRDYVDMTLRAYD